LPSLSLGIVEAVALPDGWVHLYLSPEA